MPDFPAEGYPLGPCPQDQENFVRVTHSSRHPHKLIERDGPPIRSFYRHRPMPWGKIKVMRMSVNNDA